MDNIALVDLERSTRSLPLQEDTKVESNVVLLQLSTVQRMLFQSFEVQEDNDFTEPCLCSGKMKLTMLHEQNRKGEGVQKEERMKSRTYKVHI